MGQTLTNGVYLPDEGERNCYTGLARNWRAVDNHLGSTNIHVTINDKQAWNGHVADTTIHVTSADKQAWNGHIADLVKHVTAEDKETWNGKADASALTAHTGDTTIHVTAEDKAAWNGKADDADVVHKSGAETIPGAKTFIDELTASRNATNGVIVLQNASYDPKTNGQSGVSTKSFSIKFATSLLDTFGAVDCYGLSDKTMLRFTSKYFVDAQTVIEDSVEYNLYGNGTRSFRPRNNNNCLLGESIRKWKDVNTNLINGIKPGALFLPQDRSAHVDISAYFTNTTNGSTNRFTAADDGYIFILADDVVTIHLFSQTSGGLTNFADTKGRSTAGLLYALFPVRKNDNVAVQWYTTAAAVSLSAAYFIPCKGNI